MMSILPEKMLRIIQIQTEVVRLGLDLGAVMALVVMRMQTLMKADGAVIELAEGDDMVYRAASGIAEGQLGLRVPVHGSLSGLCVTVGEALLCKDSESDSRVDREACRKVGLRSMIVMPLKDGDIVVGVIKVLSAQPHAFDEADMEVLNLISDLIASSMYNAARFESDEMFRRATYDHLTDVANRALFYDRMRQRLAQAVRQKERFAVLMIDMDGLKSINDTLSHRAGDAAIREFALRLKAAVGDTDTVARLGGDEFGIIFYKVERDMDILGLLERIDERVARPFSFENMTVTLSGSTGYASFPEDAEGLESLIEIADRRMYSQKRAKKTG
ncbi:diguanylate cyclase with GAF sensor [Leptonema illini DSM 21528]|uniref:Diguanylate cyclase with GAF sensor n=2 Tax=Leptonema illini TaxID=183 RepID=H2CG11_9LEPT|nr:sensor domain-containing diguanylate cyclase [Leptonema illini]EHQ07859.1 diguanylate cyclase with GAF sensor [Leptonema illini DSM 21528]